MTLNNGHSDTDRLPDIALVRQEHEQGCGIACLAMISGRTYAEVHDWFLGVNPDLDLAKTGIYRGDPDRFLGAHGYLYRFQFSAWFSEGWVPEPFAPVHLVNLVQPSGRQHFVVMLADGAVLDPLCDEPRSLSDWPKINHVLGIWPEPFGIADARWQRLREQYLRDGKEGS